ncbi:hypothetical protein QBC38DRAFT_23364 [Podospora fimiseda]|uniref:Infection structure specific protein n=1 Tax=Podospora fimiseda TaxID=252190 RepID=A0AAN7GRY4_9PEZI|nr:hypothetical protein QBC38DRAFT_23364 [Podospora fimiseda]
MHLSNHLFTTLALGFTSVILANPTSAATSQPLITPGPNLQNPQERAAGTACSASIKSFESAHPSPTLNDPEVRKWIFTLNLRAGYPPFDYDKDTREYWKDEKSITAMCDWVETAAHSAIPNTNIHTFPSSIAAQATSDVQMLSSWAKDVAADATKVARVCLAEGENESAAMRVLWAVKTDVAGCLQAHHVLRDGISALPEEESGAM